MCYAILESEGVPTTTRQTRCVIAAVLRAVGGWTNCSAKRPPCSRPRTKNALCVLEQLAMAGLRQLCKFASSSPTRPGLHSRFCAVLRTALHSRLDVESRRPTEPARAVHSGVAGSAGGTFHGWRMPLRNWVRNSVDLLSTTDSLVSDQAVESNIRSSTVCSINNYCLEYMRGKP